MKAKDFYKQKMHHDLQENCGARLTGEELFNLMEEYASQALSKVILPTKDMFNTNCPYKNKSNKYTSCSHINNAMNSGICSDKNHCPVYKCKYASQKQSVVLPSDCFDKINCLTGYLERWLNEPFSTPPFELKDVIEESNQWLRDQVKQLNK